MHTQITLDLVTKLPLSEVPRLGGETRLIKQTKIQVQGVFDYRDPHPIYEGLFYKSFSRGKQWWCVAEYWEKQGLPTPMEIHERQRKAHDYNLKKSDSEPSLLENGSKCGYVDQSPMQVSWEPKLGETHPKYYNFRYWGKERNGSQCWKHAKDFEKAAEQIKDWGQTPEGRAIRSALGAKRRKTLNNNIALPKDALDDLRDIYHTRDALTLAARSAGSSECFHVDHVMPLKPNLINFNGTKQRPFTGLHAPWNLQILEASENISKSNKVLPS